MDKIRVGITMGDPSGIGPAITLKAISKLKGLAEFVVIGDRWVLGQIANCPDISSGQIPKYNIVDLKNVPRKSFKFGLVKAQYGKAAIEYLDKAFELVKKKEIDCLVTCPVSKEAINMAGIKFSGHTEYLANYAKRKDFVMMLLNRKLRISLATRHIPLKDVASKVTSKELYKTIIITIEGLKTLFSIKNPRIAISGLNPHASDGGVMGKEEKTIIEPVLKRLRAKFKNIGGPLSADVAMYKAKEGFYDAVVAMYHDQALIALKVSDRKDGANITLGLPFIRTSPLHGTAFDIAGSPDKADCSSLISAIKLAVKCTLNQRKI